MAEVSHEVKISTPESDIKGHLAKGKGIIEAVIKERKPTIPSETPGKDVIIKPRSPYREFKGDHWNRASSDRSSNESVRINENNLRSVYDIRGLKEHGSPNHPMPAMNYQGSHSGSTPNTMIRAPNHPVCQLPTPPQTHSFSQVPPYYYPQGLTPNAIMPTGMPTGMATAMPAAVVPTYASTAGAQYDSYINSQFPFGNTETKVKLPPGFIPNYDSFPIELQREARLHFASLFSDLKIKYQDQNFDEYNPDLPLTNIHRTYNSYKKKLAAESCSPIIKFVFLAIFFGIDFVCQKYAGTKLGSFAKSQLDRIKSYEGMITEISVAFTGDGNEDWPIGFRIGFLLLFQATLFAGITFICAKFGIGNPQYYIDFANGMIGNSVDEVVAKKEPLPVDPLTNTTEVPKSDPVRNLMGNAQSLLALAGQTLKPGTDVVDAVGNLAASAMQRSSKNSKPNVKFGNKK